MTRSWIVAGAAFGGLAVVAGAFGAHALRARLPADALAVFETGARYLMYHALALIALGVVRATAADGSAPAARTLDAAGWAFLGGSAVFSGSLFLLALTGVRAYGAVTPFGGVSLIVGWALFAWGARR